MAFHLRKQREDLVRTLLTMSAIEAVLCAITLGSSALGAAFVALLIAAGWGARRLWSTTVHDAEVTSEPGALVFRGRRGELRVPLDTVDSVMRLEPELAVLRAGGWIYRLRLLDRAPPSTLDAVLAQIPSASGARTAVFVVRASGWKMLPDILAATSVVMGLFLTVCLFSPGPPSMFLVGQPVVLVSLLTLLVPFVQSTLTVGEDGLLVRDRWTRTFLPFTRIRSVSSGPERAIGSIRVELVDGTLRTLTQAPRLEVDAIVAQIEDHRRRHAGSVREGGLTSDARLARSGRAVSTWRRDLEQPVAFRSFAPSPEELRDVLASPAAPVDERIGAALALRRVPGEGDVRIRVAASTTANPALRVALETIAADDLDEQRLETALDGASRGAGAGE